MGPFDELTAVQRQQIREAHAQRKISEAIIHARAVDRDKVDNEAVCADGYPEHDPRDIYNGPDGIAW